MSSQAHSHAPGTARSERASTPLVDDEEPWTQEISEHSPQVPSLVWGEPEGTNEPDTEPPNEEAARSAQAWDLVRAAQTGDVEAFGQLYDRYVDVVYRYILFRVGDRTLAEDVTSETFLRALRRITSVTYQGRDVGAWFVTIARNLVLDHMKSSRYRFEVPTAELSEPHHVQTGPEQKVLEEARNMELLRCLSKLNNDQRECLVLRFLQGLSVAQTAELMGRNEGAVKALQHRAVRRLAQLLPGELR
jgi:RNA polymerase sigma-70 factor (ECF subfamily)